MRIAERGDRDCFIDLFEWFAPRVKAYLMRIGMPETVAEELAQETLLTVWRKAGRFDPSRATAAAWIFTIARNLRIDLLRRERHPDDLHYLHDGENPQTPEQDLRSSEAAKRLRAAMLTLPVEQAEVLNLAFFEERSHAEIASALGLPLGTVKSRIRLAAAHLRIRLAPAL